MTEWIELTGIGRDSNAPQDVRLIVAWKERPFEHLYLHTRVAILSSFDGDWRSGDTGEPIRTPTHWQPYMSLEEAIELGKTDSEGNWDTPVRIEAYRVRTAAIRASIQP